MITDFHHFAPFFLEKKIVIFNSFKKIHNYIRVFVDYIELMKF